MKTLVHVSKGCIQAATHRRDCHINEVESLTYYEVGEAEAFAWSLLDAVEVARGREEVEQYPFDDDVSKRGQKINTSNKGVDGVKVCEPEAPPSQEQIDAELGADHYKGWKANNPDGKCTGNVGNAGPECDRCERWKWDCEGREQWHVKH